MGHAVAHGEEDARDVVAAHEAARHDALHALVPALAIGDDHALSPVGGSDLGERLVGQGRLGVAAVGVHLLQACRKDLRVGGVVSHEQVEGDVGGAHAARGVEAGHERERQLVGAERVKVDARGGRERDDARTPRVAHARHAVGDERAVLPLEKHHVRDGPEGGNLGVLAPEVRHSQPASQLVHKLEGDSRTGKFA